MDAEDDDLRGCVRPSEELERLGARLLHQRGVPRHEEPGIPEDEQRDVVLDHPPGEESTGLVEGGRQKSLVFEAGACRVVCSSPAGEGGRAHRFLKKHPDGIGSIVFEVEDARRAFDLLEGRGGTPIDEVREATSAASSLKTFVIATPFGDTTFRFVERKGASLAWHYRMSEPLLAARRLDELRRLLVRELSPELEILDGNKVLEVRMKGADKRACALRIVERARAAGDPVVLAVGDDRTDEDLFERLPPDAWTVHVGEGPSLARFRLPHHWAVRRFLEEVAGEGR